jgi:hypothetical protein
MTLVGPVQGENCQNAARFSSTQASIEGAFCYYFYSGPASHSRAMKETSAWDARRCKSTRVPCRVTHVSFGSYAFDGRPPLCVGSSTP